jgi:hypothetical protein
VVDDHAILEENARVTFPVWNDWDPGLARSNVKTWPEPYCLVTVN